MTDRHRAVRGQIGTRATSTPGSSCSPKPALRHSPARSRARPEKLSIRPIFSPSTSSHELKRGTGSPYDPRPQSVMAGRAGIQGSGPRIGAIRIFPARPGDHHHGHIRALSGGREGASAARTCDLGFTVPTMIILDEPTNHHRHRQPRRTLREAINEFIVRAP